MRKGKGLLLTATFLLLLAAGSFSQIRMDLCSDWKYRKVNSNDAWLNAEVPGSVHADLYANGVIPDPFLDCNHKEFEWIGETAWEYSLNFNFDKNIDSYRKLFLIFEGLDTYAEVFLNGKSILRANNMFRSWKVDVTGSIKSGSNSLKIIFHPASEYISQQEQKLDFKLPGGEWSQIRKAAFQFGWDFAPRMLTCGIWQPVYIQFIPDISLCDGRINTVSVDSLEAKMLATFIISSKSIQQLTLKVVNGFDGQTIHGENVMINAGEQEVRIPFSLTNPMFWWPNGMGPQFQYSLSLVLESENQIIQTISQKVGVRSLEVVNEKDKFGTSFYFKVNGKPVFAKGANVVPPHSYLPGKMDDWVSLVANAKLSNMNMLRVWGGGIYPPDEFYRACDSLGIMVWQDFMFACSMYPWDDEFIENVRIETFQQVNRLKKFSSFAMWCGNNEVAEGWQNWGWQNEIADSIRVEEAWAGYQKLFHEILPQVVKSVDSTLFYWPSSPQFGWGKLESMIHGDSHYWGVWWGKEPFDTYKDKIPRFMSEFGFQGFPSSTTLTNFSSEKKVSDSLLSCHQKHATGFEIIDLYMKREGLKPTTTEQKVYMSQITQATGYQKAIEAHRLASPKCMGTLYWQLNDCWPAISWSGIDYFGRWKAMQYQAKRSFAPLIVVPEFRGSRIVVSVVSDFPYEVDGELSVNIYSSQGKKLGVWREYIFLKPNEAQKVIDERLYDDPSYKMPMIAVAQFNLGVNYPLFGFAVNEKWKDMELENPEITYSLVSEKGETFIEVKAKQHAFFVELSTADGNLLLEDNFFNLIPNKKHRVKILKGSADGLSVKSIWDYL